MSYYIFVLFYIKINIIFKCTLSIIISTQLKHGHLKIYPSMLRWKGKKTLSNTLFNKNTYIKMLKYR
jgi:hypothetical protein